MDLNQNQIKLIRSLGQKKFRLKYQYFVAEGDKIARDILLSSSLEIVQIYALTSWVEDNEHILSSQTDKLTTISTKQLKQISYLKTPHQVLILLRIPQGASNVSNLTEGLHFYLDDVQNPGNVGTIMRIASWFGFKSIIASPHTVDFFNPKVIQASMGSFLNIELHRTDITSELVQLPIISTVLEGDSIYSAKLPRDAIIAIGNEGTGISNEVLKKSQYAIKIPSHAESQTDSLNASITAGIVAAHMTIPTNT